MYGVYLAAERRLLATDDRLTLFATADEATKGQSTPVYLIDVDHHERDVSVAKLNRQINDIAECATNKNEEDEEDKEVKPSTFSFWKNSEGIISFVYHCGCCNPSCPGCDWQEGWDDDDDNYAETDFEDDDE